MRNGVHFISDYLETRDSYVAYGPMSLDADCHDRYGSPRAQRRLNAPQDSQYKSHAKHEQMVDINIMSDPQEQGLVIEFANGA